MKKAFCDFCEKEITGQTDWSVVRDGKTRAADFVRAAIPHSKTNDGDCCKYCFIDAVNRHDDRQRAA